MSSLLSALLGVMLVPLFVSTWRTSLLGLACQGALMALIAHQLDPALHSWAAWVTLIHLALIRGVLAPLALYTVLRARNAPARNDVIPPNLLSWSVAIAMVLMAFRFAGWLVEAPGEGQTLVAVATSGVLLGFLVLSTQSDVFSQMIGVLRIENAIALLELSSERHESIVGLELGLIGVFVLTVAFFRWYLIALDSRVATQPADTEGPTL